VTPGERRGPPAPGRPSRWLDLRLVPVAATVWAGTALAPFVPMAVLGILACLAALLSAGTLLVRRSSSAGVVLAGLLAAVAATAGSAAVREAAEAASPLRQATRPGIG